MSTWERLGAVNAEPFLDARLQLHWAAQIAAAPASSSCRPQPDGSEQSFQWDAGRRRPDPGHGHRARPFRSALRPAALSLAFWTRGEAPSPSCRSAGRTSTRATPG